MSIYTLHLYKQDTYHFVISEGHMNGATFLWFVIIQCQSTACEGSWIYIIPSFCFFKSRSYACFLYILKADLIQLWNAKKFD